MSANKTASTVFPIFKTAIVWILYILPCILIGIFIILFGVFTFLKDQIRKETIAHLPIVFSSVAVYPLLTQSNNIHLSAQAAIVMDNDSKVIIYTKNPNVRFSPASTTKLMTALVGFDQYKLNSVLQIKTLDVEGVPVGFVRGQKVTFQDLLYAMLLPSSNDAALAIADNFPGGKSAFVTKMNEKAKIFKLQNTHFADPIGLEDDQDYTTAAELVRLASIAMDNPTLANIVKQKVATITTADKSASFPLKSKNILLGIYGIDGIKTGYTDGAKEVLATSVTRNNHKYIIVVMNSEDRFADTLQLVLNVLPNVEYENISL